MYLQTSFLLKRVSTHLKHLKKMLSSTPENVVLSQEAGDKLIITLNRPKSLNAINEQLTLDLKQTLLKHQANKSLIILKGAGDKAFSAGGDLLRIKKHFMDRNYEMLGELIVRLNTCIFILHQTKTPTVALMNGITFGGGAGIASMCDYRIATERTLFSMPESKIAFHPNSAGTYFLNKAKGNLGLYLALTGDVIKGHDVKQSGFATHYCLAKNLHKLESAILDLKNINEIEDTLDSCCEKNIPQFSLEPHLDAIERCFNKRTVEDILRSLDEEGSDWAKDTVANLGKFSPSSLKVILKQMRRGKNYSLEDCLVMEANLTRNFYLFPDVIEGTRITLVDKGAKPSWYPATLEEVSEELVEKHFENTVGDYQKRVFEDIKKDVRSKL